MSGIRPETGCEEGYASLRLENQLCFPLYACSKEVIRRYKPFLDELDLTYTQYIAMMVLWQEGSISSKALGERLYLDSGTLTPLLKRLEQKGYLSRERDSRDERNLLVSITEEGERLRDRAVTVPEKMACCVKLTPEEGAELSRLLHKLMSVL
jgi:DNA-binding MarR family transcriptional regulator